MDTVNFAQFFLAFALVIGLIGLMAYAMRRYADPNRFYASKQKEIRLKVVETRYLDSKRRLVLIERDTRQHLLLISDKHDLLIESFEKITQESPREMPVLE